MFNRILISTAFVSIAGAALAADLPARTVAPSPYIAAPAFTWSGFYVGLNAGAGFNSKNDGGISSTGLSPVNNPVYSGGSGNDAGFTGGAQAGYNMQFGSFVAGVEADINFLNRNRGGSGLFPAPADLNPNGSSQSIYDDRTDFAVSRGNGSNWFGTVRGRLGVAFDRVLIFGTGGLAFSSRMSGSAVTQRDYYENSLNNDPFNPQGPIGTFTQTLRPLASTVGNNKSVGWTLGGGAEYAITQAVSLKLEYLHVDLGSNSQTFTTLTSPAPIARPGAANTMTAGNTITVRDENKFDVVRVGVNYRF